MTRDKLSKKWKKGSHWKRIETIMSHFKIESQSKLEEITGTQNSLSQYFSPPEKPKRRMITLADKLSKSLGINSDWFLTGKGEMFLKDVKGRDEISMHYEQIGKTMHDVFRSILRQEEAKKEHIPTRFIENTNVSSVPLYLHPVAAGPATDSTSPVEEYLDLPKHMIAHPAETYAVKASGDSMAGVSIEEGDILIVDSSLEAQNKNIVIASINGEQTVKRLWKEGEKISLQPGNSHYEPIEITKEMDFRILGVVTWVIRKTV